MERAMIYDVVQVGMGPVGLTFVAITVMLSTFGSLNSTMLANPRVFFAMAEDGLFIKPMAAVHPTFKTPVNAIALAAALGVTFVLLRKLEDLADAFVSAILPFYVLGVAAIFVLRRRPGYAPAFKTAGYPIVPLLFILATLYLRTGRSSQALEALGPALQRYPDNPLLLRTAGEAYLSSGNASLAARSYERANALDDSIYPIAAFGPDGTVGVLFRDRREGSMNVYFTQLGCVAGAP
jgi:amino acid transporter